LWANCDLSLTAAKHKVEKLITLKQPGHPSAFRFGLKLAPGHTYEVKDNALHVYDSTGVEWLHTPTVWGRDASGGTVDVALLDEGDLGVAVVLGDLSEAAYPIVIDPSATISGTSAVSDVFLIQVLPNANFGGSLGFVIGGMNGTTYRTLIKLDTAQIPQGIFSAFRWKMVRTADAQCTQSGRVNFYIISAGNDYNEGNSNNAIQTGECCWNKRKYNTDNWVGSARCSTSGTDFDSDASPPGVDFNSFTSGAAYWDTIVLKNSWLVDWKTGARANNGILLKETTDTAGHAYQAVSTEEASVNPYFEIDYIPITRYTRTHAGRR
jgi:hypothetical protein